MSRSDVAVIETPIGTGSDAGMVQGAHDQEVLQGRAILQDSSPSRSQEADASAGAGAGDGVASTKRNETNETNVANNATQASTRNATDATITAISNGNSPSNPSSQPRSLQGHDALQPSRKPESSTKMEQPSNRTSTAHLRISPHTTPSSSLHQQEGKGGQGESAEEDGGALAPAVPREEIPKADCTSATILVTPHRQGQENLGGGHGAMIVEHTESGKTRFCQFPFTGMFLFSYLYKSSGSGLPLINTNSATCKHCTRDWESRVGS
ncbi:hypothetical protein BJ875DRAFT_208899 [Amylocarpus encephaloides]|uniref:Uncharacterized protein n=1 Tax=Amylocarpus encephaloides TaxID=45428 RepID=A0A9P7Y8J2_9HELO|nr:hypothetical protein BJ875DRAFT_208899 [Amylocarpus encephaloides]